MWAYHVGRTPLFEKEGWWEIFLSAYQRCSAYLDPLQIPPALLGSVEYLTTNLQ